MMKSWDLFSVSRLVSKPIPSFASLGLEGFRSRLESVVSRLNSPRIRLIKASVIQSVHCQSNLQEMKSQKSRRKNPRKLTYMKSGSRDDVLLKYSTKRSANVRNFEVWVSVSDFFMKSRSRSFTTPRSRRLQSRFHHWPVAYAENFHVEGLHSVAYGSYLHLVCAVCDVTIRRICKFPNQGFGEVYWQNTRIFPHALSLFYVLLHWISTISAPG